jgi:hypothetical protein
MRRILSIGLGVVLLAVSGCAAHSAASEPTHPAPATHPHLAPTSPSPSDRLGLASQLASARQATAKYATNLEAAKADGYQPITPMIPDMGWHYRNPTIQGFDITTPPILVYERHGHTWQLAALEWVYPQTPTTPPLPGATYGSFPAACHYQDGSFILARVQELCAHHTTGARFSFWHPDLVTLHLWLWYPNPAGLYNATNPLIHPYNNT